MKKLLALGFFGGVVFISAVQVQATPVPVPGDIQYLSTLTLEGTPGQGQDKFLRKAG